MGSPADDALFYSYFITGPSGFIANVFLLILVFRNANLRHAEYMMFLTNRSIAYVLTCLQSFTLQPYAHNMYHDEPMWCALAGGLTHSLALTMIVSEPMLACNRFVSICHRPRYLQIYCHRNVYAMCAGVWIVGVLFTLPHVWFGSIGKTSGTFCLLKFDHEHLMVILLTDYLLFGVCYGVVLYCYCRIFLVITKHQQQHNETEGPISHLQEDKALLRFIGTVAILPLLIETPFFTAALIRMFDARVVDDFGMFFVCILAATRPLISSTLTLGMVRPVRKEMVAFVKKVFKRQAVTPIQQIPTASANMFLDFRQSRSSSSGALMKKEATPVASKTSAAGRIPNVPPCDHK